MKKEFLAIAMELINKNTTDFDYADNKGLMNEIEKKAMDAVNAWQKASKTIWCKEPKEGMEADFTEWEDIYNKLLTRQLEIKKELKAVISEKTGDLRVENEPIQIYIADLNAYNSGVLRGEWVSLPQDEEVLEMVMDKYSNFGQHDIAIHDYECDFKQISEYDRILSLNEIAEQVTDLSVEELQVFHGWIEQYSEDFDGAFEVIRNSDYTVWCDCDNMTQVAEAKIEESGDLEQIPEYLRDFIDYERYGRELDQNGTFSKVYSGKYTDRTGKIYNYIEFHK